MAVKMLFKYRIFIHFHKLRRDGNPDLHSTFMMNSGSEIILQMEMSSFVLLIVVINTVHHLCIHVIWSHLQSLVQEAQPILIGHSFLSLLTIPINLKSLSIFFCHVNFGAPLDLCSGLWYSESGCLTCVSSGSLITYPVNLNLLCLMTWLHGFSCVSLYNFSDRTKIMPNT